MDVDGYDGKVRVDTLPPCGLLSSSSLLVVVAFPFRGEHVLLQAASPLLASPPQSLRPTHGLLPAQFPHVVIPAQGFLHRRPYALRTAAGLLLSSGTECMK